MQSIELQTTQNVTIEYQLASLSERIMAMVIDLAIIISAYLLIMAFFLALMNADWLDTSFSFGGGAFLYICFLAYHFLMEVLGNGQSLGKRALRIQVVRLDGQKSSLGDHAIRVFFYLADLVSSMGVLGGLMIGLSPNRQRLGDMAAGTAVIKINISNRFKLEDILNISTLDDYEPQYYEVKQFSEKDMLLIKNTIGRYQRYPNDAHRAIVHKLALELAKKIQLNGIPGDAVDFLKSLIRDYIVLTR